MAIIEFYLYQEVWWVTCQSTHPSREVAFSVSSIGTNFNPKFLVRLESIKVASAPVSTNTTWETEMEEVAKVTWIIGWEGKLSPAPSPLLVGPKHLLDMWWECDHVGWGNSQSLSNPPLSLLVDNRILPSCIGSPRGRILLGATGSRETRTSHASMPVDQTSGLPVVNEPVWDRSFSLPPWAACWFWWIRRLRHQGHPVSLRLLVDLLYYVQNHEERHQPGLNCFSIGAIIIRACVTSLRGYTSWKIWASVWVKIWKELHTSDLLLLSAVTYIDTGPVRWEMI